MRRRPDRERSRERPALSREAREAKQQNYLLRALLLGVPFLGGTTWLLYRAAWWLPLALAAACALLVVGRMRYKPRRIRLDLDR